LNGGGGIKENDGGIQLRYTVSIFINFTMYPEYKNNIIKTFLIKPQINNDVPQIQQNKSKLNPKSAGRQK
jgi:hypothetical protein